MKHGKRLPTIKDMRKAISEDLAALEYLLPTIHDPINRGTLSTIIDKLREELPLLKRKKELLEVDENVTVLVDLYDSWADMDRKTLSGPLRGIYRPET